MLGFRFTFWSQISQKNWTEFSVLSKSGATLSGLYAITDNPKATIVLGHPMGKEAKGYFLKNGYTDLLLSNGYNVVIFAMEQQEMVVNLLTLSAFTFVAGEF